MVPATIGRRVAVGERRDVGADGRYVDRRIPGDVAVSASNPSRRRHLTNRWTRAAGACFAT